MDLEGLMLQFVGLVGVGALITFLINIGKVAGIVKDGTVPTWATGINLFGLVVLFLLKVFVPNADIGKLDGAAGTIAQIGVLILGLITQVLGGRLAHFSFRGTWLIGKSYSLDRGK